jgi:hypothetical protein
MPAADGGDALGFPLSRMAAVIAEAAKENLSNRSIQVGATRENEKP